MKDQHTRQIIVTGKVQGVFYRQSTREKAKELGLSGYVKNLEDGSVEIIATGTSEQLDRLAAWCRQEPPRAQVAEAGVKEISLRLFDTFSIDR